MSATELRSLSGQRSRRKPIDWSTYAFVLPAVLLLALIRGYPIIKLVLMSFQETDVLRDDAQWVGWRNYADIMDDPVI